MTAGINGVIEGARGSAGPDIGASRGDGSEDGSGKLPLESFLVGVLLFLFDDLATTSAVANDIDDGFTSTACQELP